MNPAQVEGEIERLLTRLENATLELGHLAEESGRAEVVAKVAFARAFLAADGAVANREAVATVQTEEQMLARRIAEGKVTAARELLSTIRTQIDALRTLSASLRVMA